MASEHPNCARREQVDMLHGLLHVARVKNGMPSVHRAQEYQHTVRYTELSPDRFRGFWKD